MSVPRFSRRSLLAAPVLAAMDAESPGPPPNIVFLIADDQSDTDLGCYGNPAVHTPNLDRMAAEGVRFRNCFVTSSQCSPSRSSMFTGCFPHTTLTSRLHTPMPEWQATFLEPLKAKGYFIVAMRKVHQWGEFNKRFDYYTGDARVPFDAFFDRIPEGRPFFLQVGFYEPHRPYRPGTFQPPHDPKLVQVPKFLPDTPETRADLANYYDYIARMDAGCGRLFDLLRKRGLAENTLVVFTGDNGMPFPRAKATCYDSGLKVPLLAWWPGKLPAGRVVGEMISHVDLAPTWLAAAGIGTPKRMHGRSFLDLLLGKPYEPRREVFAERNWHDNFDPIRAIRTPRHKLIYNGAPHLPYRPSWDLEDSPTWRSYIQLGRSGKLSRELMRALEPSRSVFELYDLEQDPNEFRNLAEDPACGAIRVELAERLTDWMEDTYDFLPPPHGRGAFKGGQRTVL